LVIRQLYNDFLPISSYYCTMLTHLLDLLFPPQCLNCNAQVAAHGTLCLECWQKVRFITDPYCACCGHPFDYALGEGALCGGCMQERPSFAQARAIFRYDEHSKALVTKLKFADQTQLAAIYGTWLSKFGKELVAKSDVIIPVPLHYWRFVKRRYNQSALLAKALQKNSGLAMLPDGLKRLRNPPPQVGKAKQCCWLMMS
jgi:predicted amidophosphoribosyltransferase